MTALHDIGRAKINLTLEVLGRRADGFHELRSLVAFANFGDRLALDPGDGLDLEVEGPFAAALGRGNLVLEAGRAARARVSGLRFGRFRLDPGTTRQVGHRGVLIRWEAGRKQVLWPTGHTSPCFPDT